MPRPPYPALLGAGLLLVFPRAGVAQGADAPPSVVPPSARFSTGTVMLNSFPLGLPAGFGVPVAPTAAPDSSSPAPGGTALSLPAGGVTPPAPAPAGRLEATAARIDLPGGLAGAPPPASLPPGARFDSVSVSLDATSLSLPPGFGVGGASSATASGGSPAGLPLPGLGVTDLPGTGPQTLPGAGSSVLPGLAVTEEGSGRLRFTLSADTLFDFDKASLRKEAGPVLRKLVEEVRARAPDASYRVEGHTDAIGSDTYNDGLSRRRAAAVQAWLTQQGSVPARNVSSGWFGKRQPVAPNTRPDGIDDPEGRQRNRRVEIVVTPRS